LQETKAKSSREIDKLTEHVASLESDNRELTEKLKVTQDELAKHEPKPGDTTETDNAAGTISIWWWVGGGVLAALVLVAGVWWMGERMNKDEGDIGETPVEPKNQGSEET
jgi:hypothetical protein